MARIVAAVACVALLTVGVVAIQPSRPGDAQDNTDGRLAALETTVATQGQQINALDARVAALEGASDAGEAESTTEPAQPTKTPKPSSSQKTGTRDNPVPLGKGRTLTGDWVLKVVSADPNGADAVMAENQFNDPPADGHQFFLVRLSLTNKSAESGAAFSAVDVHAVGASAVAYDSFECGVIPDELDAFTEIFPGGKIEGNVCFDIEAGDADSLVLYAEPLFSFADKDRVFFALR